MNNHPILSCKALTKTFKEGKGVLTVLENVDFTVLEKQSVAILGSSGSGKSTLLHLLGGLDQPTSGEVLWHATSLQAMSEKEKCQMRNRHLGFIYQFHYLLPEFTALENVAIPLLIGENSVCEAKEKAIYFLEKVGLADRLQHKIGELSGGERQRVAIARALVTEPACVLADEPTGNLDRQNADHVLDIMLTLQQTLKTSFVIVTHDMTLAKKMQQTYVLRDGQLHLSS